MPSSVFVTGGSGFVGHAVIDELVRRNYDVVALAGRRKIDDHVGAVRVVSGSLFEPKSLDAALGGCDAIIHLVGIIMEKRGKGITFERIHFDATKAIVDAARRNSIRRYIHMSALGTRPDAVSTYHKTKYRAERYVQQSGLDWTIFRPSLVHGPRGEFMQMEAMWARKKSPPPMFFIPFMPYFGGKHAGKLQPIYVNDVARAFVDALANPRTIGEIYPLAGPDQLTWPQLHNAVVGHRRWVASMPVPVAKILAAIGLGRLLGFNWDQVVMSQEDNTADISKVKDHFGWEPQAFETTLKSYASHL